MAHGNQNAIDVPTLLAGADLSSAQYKVVKLASTAGEVVVAAAATDAAIGILQNDPTDGQAAHIVGLGFSKAVAAASVTAGSLLASNSTGQVKTTTTANDKIIGRALEASTNAGELINIFVCPSNY